MFYTQQFRDELLGAFSYFEAIFFRHHITDARKNYIYNIFGIEYVPSAAESGDVCASSPGRRTIGAVTHVLVNDPTTGYGIFIENMMDAAG